MEPLRTNLKLPEIPASSWLVEAGPVVIAIGADAADVDAVLRLLTAVPNKSELSFVLIFRNDESRDIVAFLARQIPMRVLCIENGLRLQPNHIYVSSTNMLVEIHKAIFHLRSPISSQNLSTPFDYFLNSLAKEYGARSIAVRLANMSDDGDAGLKSISERGGFIVVQDPSEGNKNNTLLHATLVADLSLPSEHIHEFLLWLNSAIKCRAAGTSGGDKQQLIAQISCYLSWITRRDISCYRDAVILRRVLRRMTICGIKDPRGYLSVLRDQSDELQLLAKDILIHVTSFFRDPKSYEFLASTVIAKLVRQHLRTDPIRIWIAGCATGEEAYSIAILFLEEITRAKRDLKLQIFASDVSENAIARCRAGLYPHSIRDQVSASRLRRFFTKETNGYRVSPQLREAVIFTVHDIIIHPPFSRLDMIICRNVLIYMRRNVQEQILSTFFFSLRERGVLFVGIADTIEVFGDSFKPISYAHKIFERVGGLHKRPLLLSARHTKEEPQMTPQKADGEIKMTRFRSTPQRLLLPALVSFMVNYDYEILYHGGPAERYMKVSYPINGCKLIAVLQDGIAAHVQAALRRAVQKGTPATFLGAKMECDGELISVSISAQAVRIDAVDLLLVSLSEESEFYGNDRSELAEQQEELQSIEFEAELVSTRETLERKIQELEFAKEELIIANQETMSVNEELQSMNEELEASKEEMQSLNEELMVLNQQLQDSGEQQKKTAIDLRNILYSSDVATLFLDSEFNIRFFTPPAKGLFGLIASDVGRPLADLARRFTDDRLLEDAQTVLADLLPNKREIFTREDHWYLRKITPYRTEEGRVQGVVITFSDITEIKSVEHDIRAARAFAECVVETVDEPLLVIDRAQTVNVVNKALRDLFCADTQQFIGLILADTPARQLAPLLKNILDATCDVSDHVENYRVEIDVLERGRRVLMMTTRDIGGNATEAGMTLVILADITEKEKIEHELMSAKQGSDQANLVKSHFLAAASHDLRQPLQTLRLLSSIIQRKLTNNELLKLNAKCGETIDEMIDVVNTILDINQLEAGVIRPVMQSFPANMLLNKLDSEFSFLAHAKRLTWRVVRSGATLQSDPRLLLQILRNLVNNALKFTSSGRIVVGCRWRGNKIAIEVWDSGPGIRRDEMVKIFDFFQKGHTRPQGMDDGLGLGLAIVRHLSEILGHEVKLKSSIGKGSRFSVLVPLSHQPRQHLVTAAYADAMAVNESGTRILIIEDESSVREALELLLVEEGYVVSAASNGIEAVALIGPGGFSPEIIIVDYSIPGGMNGLDVIDEVRAIVGCQVSAVVLTGDISTEAFGKIVSKANIHLTKPVQVEELLESIQRLRTKTTVEWERAPATALIDPTADSSHAKTIFVIDDDVTVREAIQLLFESYGYKVKTYADGQEFFKTDSTNLNGCLVLDACIPGMDGFEVLAHVTNVHSDLPVIMITGHGDVPTAVKAIKAGAFEFIEKPVDPDQLRLTIDRALGLQSNSEEHASRRVTAAKGLACLTKRQRSVLDLIVEGRPNKIIAHQLAISQRTVESHRASVMKKLGAKTFADLIRLALAAP